VVDNVIGWLIMAALAWPVVRSGHQLWQARGNAWDADRLYPVAVITTFALFIGAILARHVVGPYLWAILFIVYLCVAFRVWSYFAKRRTEDTVQRGTEIVNRLNAGTRKGKTTDTDLTIGGVLIPAQLEAQHLLITGTTGAGKTQVINGLLRTIRARGQRAIIADPAGGFYARFGQSDDALLNPFDRRSVDWSPFAEIQADYDCDRIAKAIMPDVAGSSEAQWQMYGQTLLAKVMLSMHRQGDHSTRQLLHWLTSANADELAPLLAGTPAAILTQPGNEKMLNNTRAGMVPYLAIFDYLPDRGRFSVRRWLSDESRRDWLFVTYRDDQMAMLRHFVALVLELAMVEGLSLSEDQARGLWFVFDEVDSLGKVSSLRAGLTKLRKYGGRVVLGLQTIAQLRTTYGRDEAQTLLSNTSTKCILRAGDAETAKSMEHELGEQEIARTQISYSSGGSGDSRSESTQIVRQSTVMASELMSQADLHGFLKMPGWEVAMIRVPYVAMPEVNAAFE
jgi:type IV secretory pathway TraG/TraD family ATPase VirD4